MVLALFGGFAGEVEVGVGEEREGLVVSEGVRFWMVWGVCSGL